MSDLILMIPEWFQRVIEFPEIMKAWEYALDQFDGNLNQVWDNQYIQTCDSDTLSLYEKLLGIIPSGTDSLEYRRAVVMQKYSMTVPFSIGFLKSMLSQIYGDNSVSVDAINSALLVMLYESANENLDSVWQLLYDIVPAHIAITLIKQLSILIEDTGYAGSYINSYSRVFIPL